MRFGSSIILSAITSVLMLLLYGVTPILAGALPGGVKTIMIDPGHGGKDPGAVFRDPATKKLHTEKEINLNVSLLLGEMIKKNLPDVKVLYTRDTDIFIDLYKRGDMANKAGADLFVSVHTNAVERGAPSGTMTFIMGHDVAKNKQNLEIAMMENDVITYESNYESRYEGYVPGSSESFIIFSLMQYSNQNQSMEFATTLQRHYKQSTALADLNARQQNFLVLWKTAMPSVLTELGFITTKKDRDYLTSSRGQKAMATALFNAFSEYKAKVEGNTNHITLDAENYAAESTPSRYEPATVSDRESSTLSSAATNGIVYRVQIGSGRNRLGRGDALLRPYNWDDVTIIRFGSIYKYYVGGHTTHREAQRELRKVKRDVSDAFIVAFDENNRIVPLNEARRKTD